MSSLTDRYVWGVLRSVPDDKRPELEPEIRALIADAIEAHGGDAAAERAALAELGDPEILAARYTDRTLHLIGPRYFLTWKRLLQVTLPSIVPIAAVAVMAAQVLTGHGDDIGRVVGSGVSVAFQLAFQLIFWITVVFAIIERADDKPVELAGAWSPDDLPDLPAVGRQSPVELAVSMAGLVFAAVFIVWQQVASPIAFGGATYPLFDAALWSFWLPWFLLVVALEIVFTAVAYRAGRWTRRFAALHAALAAAFALPALWLLSTDRLLDPGAVQALTAAGFGDAIGPVSVAVGIAIILVCWDSVQGLVRAFRAPGAPQSGLPEA